MIRSIGVSEIIRPEQDYAATYASQSLLGDLFQRWYQVTETHHLYKIKTPGALVGQTLKTIDFQTNFGIRLVGVERAKEVRNLIGLKQTEYYVVDPLTDDLVLEANDKLILFGKMEVLHKIKEL